MAISDKAQATLFRLNKIIEARDGVDEAKALEGLRGQLLQLADPINLCASNAKLLANQGAALSSVIEIGSVIETVRKVLMRFVEIPKSTTLRQGTRWTGLSSKLEALATKVSEVQANDWKTFFDGNFFGGLPPAQREAKLILAIPGNKEAIERYKMLYQSFIKYRTNIPKDAEELKVIRATSEQLSEIKFENKNIPDDVRKFFEATNTGASLDLLTNEVIEWLRSNNLLSRYVVRAKLI